MHGIHIEADSRFDLLFKASVDWRLPRCEVAIQRRSSSPYSRATGLQLGQRRSNTRTGCQNQRCSLTKHRLDRYANPKLHHCKKPQTQIGNQRKSTKKTRPWKQTGRRARNRTSSSKIASAPGDKVRAHKGANLLPKVPVALRATCAA